MGQTVTSQCLCLLEYVYVAAFILLGPGLPLLRPPQKREGTGQKSVRSNSQKGTTAVHGAKQPVIHSGALYIIALQKL